MAREVCGLLREGGCGSVHIGGGEPFLNFEGLIGMVRELRRARISLEYVETNAYWAAGSNATEKLEILIREGVNSLCVSLDPYHAEYVPYEYPLLLAKRCEEAGMGCFLWQERFLPDLKRLDGKKVHRRAEMEAAIASGYIWNTARAYGIHFGGRAVNIETEYSPFRSVEALLGDASAGDPCRNLLSSGHFHVDMHGCFIPPGCTGIRLPLAEVIRGIPSGKYPVFEALYSDGVLSLYTLARKQGFTAGAKGYSSRCAFCFHLRRGLAGDGAGGGGYAELDREYYDEALRYYD
jgi:hypothetical protein